MFPQGPQPLGSCLLSVLRQSFTQGPRLALNSVCSSNWPWLCVTGWCHQAQGSSFEQTVSNGICVSRMYLHGLVFVGRWKNEVGFLRELPWDGSNPPPQPFCFPLPYWLWYLSADRGSLSPLKSRAPSYFRPCSCSASSALS